MGDILSKYTCGKTPKAFDVLPQMQNWENLLILTHPEKWTPQAMFTATKFFVTNGEISRIETFLKNFLLESIRRNIKEKQKLNYHYYSSLLKAFYRPAAWFKAILFPLCQEGCTIREAHIIGSVIARRSVPMSHSSVALIKLAGMPLKGPTVYFMKLLLQKRYALPKRAIQSVCAYFQSYANYKEKLPVLWHQSLLELIKLYGGSLEESQFNGVVALCKKQSHYLITPTIFKELKRARKEQGGKSLDISMVSTSAMQIE